MTRFWTTLGSAALLSLVAVACGGSESSTSSASPEVNAAPNAPATINTLFDKIDKECAGNDNGFVTSYAVDKFDAAAIMKDIKGEDKDKMGVDCSDQRGYSTSREDAVKSFHDFLGDTSEDAKACVEGVLSASERQRLAALIDDPTNLGVFSNIYAGGDNPEACSYYEFDVYRADGTHARFVFNYTD